MLYNVFLFFLFSTLSVSSTVASAGTRALVSLFIIYSFFNIFLVAWFRLLYVCAVILFLILCIIEFSLLYFNRSL
jgi:hypothetical protein